MVLQIYDGDHLNSLAISAGSSTIPAGSGFSDETGAGAGGVGGTQ
jgi:hypothetical protein